MKTSPISDLSKLCVHTVTNRPWNIDEASANYARVGVSGISVWQDALEGRDPGQTGRMLRDRGLKIISYVRGGFFPAIEAGGRLAAIDNNRKMIAEAAELGAPLLVLVCGAVPGQALELSRRQIEDGIAAIVSDAQKAGIRLGIEPLHPMYADSRSAVNTLKQANELAEKINSPQLGVVVDVYHLWWDPDLQEQISRCGRSGNLLAFHICDWKTPTEDLLLDRELMGQGCIDVHQIRGWVEASGFDGFHEVEIFSKKYWEMDQKEFLDKIVEAYLHHV